MVMIYIIVVVNVGDGCCKNNFNTCFRIQDILGYSPADVVGQSLYNFHHGVDNEVLTECHKTCKCNNNIITHSTCIIVLV